jgi:hypothetical protein
MPKVAESGNYVAVSPKANRRAPAIVGHAKDDRDNQADEQDSGAGERVRPQVDEAHDKYDDNPDHCYCGKDGHVKSPE